MWDLVLFTSHIHIWKWTKYSNCLLVTLTLSSLCHCTLWASGHKAGSQMTNPQVFIADLQPHSWQLKVTRDSNLTWQNSGGSTCSVHQVRNRPPGGSRHQNLSVVRRWNVTVNVLYHLCNLSNVPVIAMEGGSGALLDLIQVNDLTISWLHKKQARLYRDDNRVFVLNEPGSAWLGQQQSWIGLRTTLLVRFRGCYRSHWFRLCK